MISDTVFIPWLQGTGSAMEPFRMLVIDGCDAVTESSMLPGFDCMDSEPLLSDESADDIV
jgi:hypothetical protein